ncbi:PAS domain S-box protein [Haloarchaeobius sp. DT45]|uniref:PAS domain S-box protein n=1 Tax=Haloarchaeobius sp. DT45 TaxID=3446116 RepID=UPI003F6CEA56
MSGRSTGGVERTGEGRRSETETILLLVEPARDRELLADWLTREYEVVTGIDRLSEPFDLCILDEQSLGRYRDRLDRQKAAVRPAYLPYLLVSFESEPSALPASVWSTVDELLATPVSKPDLARRVDRLLHTRSLSLELEAQRRRSEGRLAALFEHVPDPIVVVDDDGTVLDTNVAFTDRFGLDRQNVVGQPFTSVACWDAERVEPILDALLAGEEPPTQTVRCETASGTERVVELHAGSTDEAEQFDERIIVCRDVTERVTRERELANEQAFTQSVIDALPDVFFLIGTDGTFERWNRRLPEVTGYTDAELAEMNPLDLSDSSHEEFGSVLGGLDAIEPGTTAARDLVTKWGESIPYESVFAPIHGSDGEFIGVAGIARDISERKARERDLLAQEELYRTLAEHFPNGMVALFDRDLRYTLVEPDTLPVSGRSSDDLVGHEAGELLPPDIREAVVASYRDAVRGLENQFEVSMDGETYRFQTVPVSASRDDGVAGMVVIQDVTDAVERKRELERQNERLDEFASVVSHDLRNPMNVASGYLDLALADGEDENVREARRALDRMRDLVDELLVLARQGDAVADLAPVSLSKVVQEAWDHVDTREATLQADADVVVSADADRLTQLFENLFRNSVEHGDETVTVTVGTLDDGFFVADDGPGFPDDDRDRLFEHGFTTREDGTGFGLSIVASIVEAHGWEITAPVDAEGARFEIRGVEFV